MVSLRSQCPSPSEQTHIAGGAAPMRCGGLHLPLHFVAVPIPAGPVGASIALPVLTAARTVLPAGAVVCRPFGGPVAASGPIRSSRPLQAGRLPQPPRLGAQGSPVADRAGWESVQRGTR